MEKKKKKFHFPDLAPSNFCVTPLWFPDFHQTSEVGKHRLLPISNICSYTRVGKRLDSAAVVSAPRNLDVALPEPDRTPAPHSPSVGPDIQMSHDHDWN